MSITSIPARLRSGTLLITPQDEKESRLSKFIESEVKDIKSPTLWRGALAEFLGSALLCIFTIGMGTKTEEQKQAEGGLLLLKAAIGSGFFLAAVISALNHISGAHVNPAMSVGFLVIGQVTFLRCLMYCLFQTAGAIAGTGLLKLIVPSEFAGNLGLITPGPGITIYEALGIEIVVTFFLIFVVLSMVDPGRDDLAGSVPLMVGLTVTCNTLFAGHLSGACMNPARSFGPAVLLGDFEVNWIYWAGPMIGSILGALIYDWFFSTSPLVVKNFKKVVGGKKVEFKIQNSADSVTKDVEKEDNQDLDYENDELEEIPKSFLKERLRREHTGGIPWELERRRSYEHRRVISKNERFRCGSVGHIFIMERDVAFS